MNYFVREKNWNSFLGAEIWKKSAKNNWAYHWQWIANKGKEHIFLSTTSNSLYDLVCLIYIHSFQLCCVFESNSQAFLFFIWFASVKSYNGMRNGSHCCAAQLAQNKYWFFFHKYFDRNSELRPLFYARRCIKQKNHLYI